MSTRENIRLIARSPLKDTLSRERERERERDRERERERERERVHGSDRSKNMMSPLGAI